MEDEGSLEGVPEEEIGGETQNVDNDTAVVEVNGEAKNSENLNGTAPALTVEIVNGMGIKDLRVELGKRGLSKKGRKKDLTDRLAKAVEDNVPLLENVVVNEDEALIAPDDGFAAHARWKIVNPSEDDVIDEASLQTIDGV